MTDQNQNESAEVQTGDVALRRKFLDLVKYTKEMRRLQKAYFKQRLQADLIASKKAEATVDQLLTSIEWDLLEIHERKRRARQSELFKGGG